MSRFANKVVIVTGSSTGIGQSAVVLFAKEGAKVTVHGRDEKKLAATVDRLHSSGVTDDRILVVAGEIQDEKVQDALIGKTVEKFGKLDVLVNNAGIMVKNGVEPNTVDNFDYIYNVNIRSPFRLAFLAAPHLEKTKGAIVNISSIGSIKPYSKNIPYGTSKAALDMITKSLALLLAPKGIRVNSLNPGLVRTEFLTRFGIVGDVLDKIEDSFNIPFERGSSAEEQAKSLLFLASDDASYMTGTILVNDGGLLLGKDYHLE